MRRLCGRPDPFLVPLLAVLGPPRKPGFWRGRASPQGLGPCPWPAFGPWPLRLLLRGFRFAGSLCHFGINLFLTQLDDSLREIEAASVEPDLESIRFASHKLKSSSAAVGAAGIAALYAELEKMAGEGKLEPVRTRLDRLKSAYPQVRSELLEIREELGSE